MLNSLQLTTTDHYTLKLKSMFDLAIATQRYSSPFPTHHHHHHHQQEPNATTNFPLNQPRHQHSYTSGSSPLNAPKPPQLERNLVAPPPGIPSVANLLHPQMEEVGVSVGGGGGGTRDEIRDFSLESAAKKSAFDSVNSLDSAMSHINYNNNLIGGSLPGDQPLNFMNPRGAPSSDGGEGRQRGKKQGPPAAGKKTSFSIESLLAHSNSWRRNQDFSPEGGARCTSGGGKDVRFSPYALPHPPQEQIRSSTRQGPCSPDPKVAGKPAVGVSQTDNEKRPETYGGTNGSKSGGTGRRAAKSKRVRTIFTPEQLERLEAEFERQQYMVGPERLYLASSLYLTEAQVKVWFQNRRIKWRKQHLEMEQQRLAIYRTLAEQDMMSSVEEEDQDDSVDCDYSVDEGEFEGEASGGGGEDSDQLPRHSHSPLPPHGNQPPLHPPPPHMFSQSNNNPGRPPAQSSTSSLSSKHFKAGGDNCIGKFPDPRNCLQQQRQTPNDEYDTCSPATSTASSPSSSSRGGTIPIQLGNHGVVQGGKK